VNRGFVMSLNAIQLPVWVSTGMVFQQGVPLHLHGSAQRHITIRLEIVKDPTDGRKVSKLDTDYGIIHSKDTRADENGSFYFSLPSYKASTDAYTFIFSTPNETITVKDLRCGDVWLFFGSAPLSVPISKTGAPRTPLKDSALKLIRFFTSLREGVPADEPCSFVPKSSLLQSSWITVRDGTALAGVTSVGFSMAYHLADQLHYPIGIIDLAVQGSAIYSWISRKSFLSDPDLVAILNDKQLYLDEEEWGRRFSGAGEEPAVSEETAADPASEPGQANTAPAPEQDLVHKTVSSAGNMKLMAEIPIIHTEKKTIPIADIPQERRMTLLYNHKIAPLLNMNIRGIVFAPDQQDSLFTDRYDTLMRVLLADLAEVFGPRKITSRQNIPSLILLRTHPEYADAADPYRLTMFNEAVSAIRQKLPMPIGVLSQHDMLLPEKAMTFYLGRRLSFIAMGLHFTPKMPTSSPECNGVEIVGNKAMLSFDNTNDGLKLAENESVLRGFSVCGDDRVYRPAQAKVLHGVRVMVWHDDISVPRGVTYGFSPIPHNATFRSRTDLPVVPFRFDREPSRYSPDLTFTHCDQLTFVGLEKPDSDFSVLPVYEVCRGSGTIYLETLNRTEGSGSLRIEYITEGGAFSIAPILRYASLYAPLDLSSFRTVKIDVFNPDQQTKELHVAGFDGPVTIKTGLMWQTLQLTYSESGPMMLTHFEMTVLDPQKKGSIYIDNIRFFQ